VNYRETISDAELYEITAIEVWPRRTAPCRVPGLRDPLRRSLTRLAFCPLLCSRLLTQLAPPVGVPPLRLAPANAVAPTRLGRWRVIGRTTAADRAGLAATAIPEASLQGSPVGLPGHGQRSRSSPYTHTNRIEMLLPQGYSGPPSAFVGSIPGG
jgi:hypothetical protein